MKIATTKKALADDIYYVSAADVADKIIDHMQRGLGPLLFRSHQSALVSVGVVSSIRSRKKLD
jgi:hypothetical protein